MGLPVRDQVRYWGIAAVVFLVVIWALGDVLLPFIVGGAIAYFLDPVADRLQRLGLGRTAATVVISLGAMLAMTVAMLLIIPALIQQGIALANAAPEILRQFLAFLGERFPDLVDAQSTLRQSLAGLGDTVRDRVLALANTLLTSALGVVGFFVFVLVVPVVAFYLLLDWDRMVAHIDALLPRDHAPVIRRLADEVDAVLAGFVRGQLTVCGVLAVYYAAALMVVGLQFGLVVGAVAGLISFIPYIGAIVGGVLAIGLAVFQFWNEPWLIGVVAVIFGIGQVLEGNVLVPKLVGGSVGLHPVWLLFALSAFGTLFGFVGMLIAVPVAAVIGVLARFGAQQYAGSSLFTGLSKGVPRDGDGDRDGTAG